MRGQPWTLDTNQDVQRFLKELAENSQLRKEAEKLGKTLSNVRG
jgi:hypothetical protein